MKSRRANVGVYPLVSSVRARAFSLIEVLMAVLILGLGLLGLGAVLPVVVRQQVASNDATVGAAAMESAIQTMKAASRLESVKWKGYGYIGNGTYTQDPALRMFLANRGWFVPAIDPLTCATVLFPRADEAVYFSPGFREQIQIGDRLFPGDSAKDTEPQMVWDIAVRKDETLQSTNGYQVAVFVRRVDPRASAGLTVSLYRAIADPTSPEFRYPVSVEAATGRPMYDGSKDIAFTAYAYSTPFVVEVAPVRDATNVILRDRLQVVLASRGDDYGLPRGSTPMNADVAFELLSQPGQKIVDNLGNVYTVQGADPEIARTSRVLKLVSPIPASATFPPNGYHPAGNVLEPALLTHIVGTPQVPVSVSVFNVN